MKLQDKREALEKGDPVFLVVQMGEGLTKRKPAKVVELRRGAALLLVGTEKTPRLVRLSDIELPETTVPTPAVYVDTRINTGPQMIAEVPYDMPVVVIPASAPTPMLSAYETWLRMGEELLEEQKLELAMLDTEEQAVRAEEADMREQIAIIEELLKDIPNRLAEIPYRRQRVQQQIDTLKAKLGRT